MEAKTASINLAWLYFYLDISIRIFCTLSICFVLDLSIAFTIQFFFECFIPNIRLLWKILTTVKPLNSGHLRVLKNLSAIKRCTLLRGSLTKIVTFRTKHFVRYSRHVRYLRCPLLRGFTVLSCCHSNTFRDKNFINRSTL